MSGLGSHGSIPCVIDPWPAKVRWQAPARSGDAGPKRAVSRPHPAVSAGSDAQTQLRPIVVLALTYGPQVTVIIDKSVYPHVLWISLCIGIDPGDARQAARPPRRSGEKNAKLSISCRINRLIVKQPENRPEARETPLGQTVFLHCAQLIRPQAALQLAEPPAHALSSPNSAGAAAIAHRLQERTPPPRQR